MAVENEVQNAELAYLLFPFEQYANLNGKPLVGGHIEVYQAGTDTKYITYQDWDGDVNPFKIPIPADGRIVALADPSLTYDVYVYDSFNNLVCSRLNIQCNVPGEINLSGVDTYVRNTDGTLDVSLQTSGNNRRVFTVNTKNKLLDVQEPLYFVENSETATIIGFDESGNYATTAYVGDAIASSISSKVDITAFNEEITNITNNITALSADVDGKMDESKLEYNSHDEISGYNGTAFAGGQGDPEVNDLVHANSAAWNEVTGKLDATAFNPNEFYPSTNPSGFINKTSADELYQPKGNYASATDLTAYQTIEGMTAYQPSGDYATHDDLTAYQTVDDMSAYQPSGDYATKDDVSALDNKINDVSAAIPDVTNFLTKSSADTLYQPTGDYATHDDLTAYQTVEGMTAYQLSGDYATNTDLQAVSAEVSGKQDKLTIWPVAAGDNIKIEESGNQIVISTNLTGTDYVERDELSAYQTTADMSAYQPSGDYAYASALDGKVDTSSFSSFSSTTNEHIEYISAALSGEYELSAGSGINITDYPNEQKTVISVTAQGPNQEVESEVIAHSADWNTVTAKANADDLTAYQTVDGMSAYQPSGDYATHDDLTAYQPSGDYAYASAVSAAITGSQSVALQISGGYGNGLQIDGGASVYVGPGGHINVSNGANLNLNNGGIVNVADGSEINLSSFANISGTSAGITASDWVTSGGIRLSDMTAYQPASGMTAYQPAGSYLTADALDTVSADWNEVSAKLDTTAFSDVSGSFLTEVPDTYLQNTDLTITDGKVTEISGVPLSAGDELPSGVMNTSALEYNAVNEISGYNGSAIAQYGAEKQWLQHDDTLVHAANSAQYALGVNVSAVAQLIGEYPISITESGTYTINSTYMSGTSYLNWYYLSNGMCRIKGQLKPTPSMPAAWHSVQIASNGASALLDNTFIPTVIDWEGWVDYLSWFSDGTINFNCRELSPTAANRLIYVDYLGIPKR